MTFDRPLLLALLALAPLAWLVGRLRRRRVTVVVPSLLIYERALARLAAAPPPPPVGAERRRPLDRRLLAEVAAAALLAVAAAGPRGSAAGAPIRLGLALDDTPSMRAAGRAEAAERALAAIRAQLIPEDELIVVRASEAPPGVADPLAWAGTALRARGVDSVATIADDVGGGGPNLGIVAAGAREGEVLIRTNADDAIVYVKDARGDVVLEGRGREVRGALPGEGPFVARLATSDSLPDDDAVSLVPPGAPVRVDLRGGTSTVALVRAISAAGGAAGGDVDARAPATVVFEVAAGPGDGPPPERLIAHESPRFPFSSADLAAQEVRVAPAAPPGGAGALRPLLTDERGRPLIGYRDEAARTYVWIGVPLEATDWPKRRSFPAFVAEAIAPYASETDWRAIGLLSARETEEAARASAAPPPPPDLAALRRGTGRGAPLALPLLLLGAAAMLAAWALARERSIPDLAGTCEAGFGGPAPCAAS